MVDKTPILNGMSVKQRAKHYDVHSRNRNPESSMKRRDNSYTGLKLSQQEPSQKGPQLKKRGKSKTGKTSPDKHLYANNNQFKLVIGMYSVKCSKISNLSMEQSIEEVAEGGKNDAPWIFQNRGQKNDTLQIERALVNDTVAHEFQPGVYVPGGVVTIMRYGKEYREFAFGEGMITKVEFSDLDAMGSEVMIQKLEIAHSGLYYTD